MGDAYESEFSFLAPIDTLCQTACANMEDLLVEHEI